MSVYLDRHNAPATRFNPRCNVYVYEHRNGWGHIVRKFTTNDRTQPGSWYIVPNPRTRAIASAKRLARNGKDVYVLVVGGRWNGKRIWDCQWTET